MTPNARNLPGCQHRMHRTPLAAGNRSAVYQRGRPHNIVLRLQQLQLLEICAFVSILNPVPELVQTCFATGAIVGMQRLRQRPVRVLNKAKSVRYSSESGPRPAKSADLPIHAIPSGSPDAHAGPWPDNRLRDAWTSPSWTSIVFVNPPCQAAQCKRRPSVNGPPDRFTIHASTTSRTTPRVVSAISVRHGFPPAAALRIRAYAWTCGANRKIPVPASSPGAGVLL